LSHEISQNRHLRTKVFGRLTVIRPLVLCAAGNSYYFSNWGAAGLCAAYPNVGPKPSYVAYAVLTQMLDGNVFSHFVTLDSTVLYAGEFKKRENAFVSCLWTLRGSRPVSLKVPGIAAIKLINLMGRETNVTVTNDK
jgi:hypothetical protein